MANFIRNTQVKAMTSICDCQAEGPWSWLTARRRR